MPMRLEDKKAMVTEVNEVASKALSLVAADYHGLSAGEMTELRAKARENGTWLRVVKNSLAKRALSGTEFECMDEVLVGPLMLGFSLEDPGAAARLMKDFGKDHEALEVKALSVSGELLAAGDLDRLASLPTRDQALAMLMGVMQAPIGKLARTLNEVPAQATRVVAAVRDQKQEAA